MFAARANQENAIHQQQLAAQQNVKALAPKTPGNKTPFRGGGGGKHDENAIVPLPGKAEGVKTDRNAFVTPANPRTTRAPLGNKTTNARAPTLQPTVTKPTGNSTTTRRHGPKIKVLETTTPSEDILQDDTEREIEYMPPPAIPLPDHSLDEEIFPRDRDLSCLEGRNLTRGWWAEYAPEEDKDEGELSDFDEKCRKAEIARKKKSVAERASAAGTVSSRGAAAALGTKPVLSRERKPVINKERKPLGAATAKPLPPKTYGNPRFIAAKAASNSTIGYSKGRAVSRGPLHTQGIFKNVEEKNTKTTALEDLLRGFGDLDVEDDLLGGEEIQGEEDCFQLEGMGEF